MDARFFLARLLGAEAASPFPELESVRQVEEMRVVPTLARIRAAWSQGTEALLQRLTDIHAEELAAETETVFPIGEKTLLGTIAFLAHHEAYHIGQMAMIRKSLGLGSMRYA